MFINEDFLSFIWQQSYFNTPNLHTTTGSRIHIIDRGFLNTNAGPDFLEAKIKIGEIIWAGDIEIHINSSHWIRHNHIKDSSYNRVVLHVVYKNDDSNDIVRYDGTKMPTLELEKLIDKKLLFNYHHLINSTPSVHCSNQLGLISKITIVSMLEKAMVQRLESKSEIVFKTFDQCENDWEVTTYRILMRNFGFKVNQNIMQLLSKFLPYRLILKIRNNETQLEALFFGMAGLLENTGDTYQKELQAEYEYLKHKFNLKAEFIKRHQWKFMRMHPQNFPSIRLAQLIKLLSGITNLFSYIINVKTRNQVIYDFSVVQSLYWQDHYDFNKPSRRKISGLGITSIDNIIINTFIPILVAYSKTIDDYTYIDKAIYLLENIPAEKNRILNIWKDLDIHPVNASESQGLIELYNNYCYKKRCLNCNIGSGILLKN